MLFPFPGRSVVLALTSLILCACGANYETIAIKDYRLHVVNKDESLQTEFRNLVAEFNFKADRKVLTYVDDASDANSAIIITKNLEARDGKVGWGQWLSESEEDNPIFHAPGSQPKRRVEYSMRLEFDEDYIRERMNTGDWESIVEKQKLFFHEVGHGLEMSHHRSRADVMYHDISGTKNFDTFFKRVRNYMSDQ